MHPRVYSEADVKEIMNILRGYTKLGRRLAASPVPSDSEIGVAYSEAVSLRRRMNGYEQLFGEEIVPLEEIIENLGMEIVVDLP